METKAGVEKPLAEWTLQDAKEFCVAYGENCTPCPLYHHCGQVFRAWDLSEKPEFTDGEKWDANHLVRIFGNTHITIGRNDIGEAYVIAHRNVGCGNGFLINKNLFPSIKNGGKFSVSEILGDADA